MEKVITVNLATALNKLIEAKQVRDNKKFNAAKLAQAINVDRSLIQRILSEEVVNPTLNTIIKIANFFIEDGFNLSLDDLIGLNNSLIDVDTQEISLEKACKLPLYQMENFTGETIGEVSVNIQSPQLSPAIIAVVSHDDMPPIFKAGSIFIIDMMRNPKQGNLIALKLEGNIKIAKLTGSKEEKILKFFSKEEQNVEYDTFAKSKILGVVIRINAKT